MVEGQGGSVKVFFKPKITQFTHLFSFASFLEITNKCDQCNYEYSHLCPDQTSLLTKEENIAKGTTDPRLEFISQYYIYYKINSGPKGPTIAEFVKHPVTG